MVQAPEKVSAVDLTNPDVAKLLADPALFKRLRKENRAGSKDALTEIALTIVSECLTTAREVIHERTGKSVKHIVVSRDGSIRIALYMRGKREDGTEDDADADESETTGDDAPTASGKTPTDAAPAPEAHANGKEPAKRGRKAKATA